MPDAGKTVARPSAHRSAAAALAALAAACAPAETPLATYGAGGAAMPASAPAAMMRSTGGRLERRGQCLVIDTPDGVILPVWPAGTRVTQDQVITPERGWRRPLEIGRVVMVDGQYLFAHDGSLQRAAGDSAAACAARGVLVGHARRAIAATNASELARDAEAVLVVRADAVDSAAPATDGFKTTIEATVLEVLKGPYRAGEPLRIRHVHGQGSPMLAHSPHIPAPGDHALLFVSLETYFGQAEARGGKPLPGYVGAGGGLFRVEDGRIVNASDLEMPGSVAELRRQMPLED